MMRTLVLSLSLAFAGLVATTAHAQALEHGTIVGLQAIDNRGADETQGTKVRKGLGKMFGNMAGSLGMVKSSEVGGVGGQVGMAASAMAPQAGENLAGQMGSQGPAAHYMVKVQLDAGRVVTLVKDGSAVQGLQVGSKVAVSGSGSATQITAE